MLYIMSSRLVPVACRVSCLGASSLSINCLVALLGGVAADRSVRRCCSRYHHQLLDACPVGSLGIGAGLACFLFPYQRKAVGWMSWREQRWEEGPAAAVPPGGPTAVDPLGNTDSEMELNGEPYASGQSPSCWWESFGHRN